jgi:short-subunit dehydrogenase
MKTRHLGGSLVLYAALLSSTVVHEGCAFSLQMSSAKTAVVAGATGYIGKSVVRESVRQGYKTVALVRDRSKVTSKEGDALYGQFFEGADVVECDVCDPDQLKKVGISY